MHMALSETQLSGLKKSLTAIMESDLDRILIALGLRKVPATEPDSQPHEMKINATWTANAYATVLSHEHKKTWRVELFVTRTADKTRVGPVYRFEDMNVLQRKGAAVMGEMFASVDDLAPFTCGECGSGLLTWDGNVGNRTIKPGMVCGACGWRGHTGGWLPYRELR
jgi:hypothetical protein